MGALIGVLSLTATAHAVPCSTYESGKSIYGSGGSAATGTIRRVAQGLKGLPEAERITVFYHDKLSACGGYGQLLNPEATAATLVFLTWDANGAESSCDGPAENVSFSHMGNTPLLCPGNQPLPKGYAAHIAAVQSTNVITDITSTYSSISAEALYYILGFGPEAAGKGVAPWTDKTNLWGRSTSSFVHQLIAGAVKVPATLTKIEANRQLATNDLIALGVAGEHPSIVSPGGNSSLGYVSGSAAEFRRAKVKTLAYQHFDQSCGYLPDSTGDSFDKANVRSGQYYLWTPGWLYTKVSGGKAVAQDGETLLPEVDDFVGYFTGTKESPVVNVTWDPDSDGTTANDIGPLTDLQQVIIKTGDIPLCAMHAIRPKGDLSPIQSYQPEKPCNGYFEKTATGTTDYVTCDEDADCSGDDEICSFGYCEVTYPDATN